MATATEKYVTGDDELYTVTPTSTNWVSQTFTIGNVGINIAFVLSSIELKLERLITGKTVTFEIYDVDPAGGPATQSATPLSSGTINSTNVSNESGGTWTGVSMSSATLQPSTKYALVIRAESSAVDMRADGSSPTYGGGTVWTTTDSGDSWTEDATTDLMFQINGADEDGTLCTTGEAIAKAGAEASATATSPLLVSQLVQQAEGYINAETEFNWNDEYANLNNDVKFILNRVCSADAAINIIAYDIGNYSSRVLAETMINVYRETVFNGLQTLRDQAKKNFMRSLNP